jgi:glycosyltransferase involved in cell wall biosynthesis
MAASSRRLLRHLCQPWYRAGLWNEFRAGHRADAVTVVSRRVALEMSLLLAVPPRRMALLPNCHTGTTPDLDAARALRRSLGLTERNVVFLFAGRDEDPIKRPDHVQACFAHVHRDFPEARLWMMPGATAAPHPAVLPTGALSIRDGELIYQAADIFVNASRYDGMPISVLQALAAGRPTIATAAGGCEDVITDGVDGLLLPRSAAGLEHAMRRLLSDAGLREALGANARVRARAFAPDAIAARLERVYARTL